MTDDELREVTTEDAAPTVYWCLKVSGDTCPRPCAGGCDT